VHKHDDNTTPCTGSETADLHTHKQIKIKSNQKTALFTTGLVHISNSTIP